MDELIANLTLGRPLQRIPWRERWIAPNTLLVLLDLSDDMKVFRRDQLNLLDSLRRVLGQHRMKVGFYRDLPHRGVGIEGGTKLGLKDVLKGRLPGNDVLFLCDLSSSKKPQSQLWRHFVRTMGQRNRRIFFLSPIAEEQVNFSFGAPLMLWDRSTGMRSIRAIREKEQRR